MKNEKHILSEGTSDSWEDLAIRLLKGYLPADALEIYSGRNRIVTFAHDGIQVAVKFFSRSIKNRLVYSLFSSKAKRSYLYALELQKRAIDTPQPLAYAERRGALNTLQDSLYICRYEEAVDLRDYLETGAEAWDNFAAFAAQLHQKGIIHRDLNNTNVRLSIDKNGLPHFSLIDLNRIKFLPPGQTPKLAEAATNLVRFSYHTPDFDRFAGRYCELRNLPPESCQQIIKTKIRHERKK